MKKFTKETLVALSLALMVCIAPLAHAAESTSTVITATAVTTSASSTSVSATTTVTASSTVTTSTGNSVIAGLLAQLAKLTALFNSLKAQMMGVTAQIQTVKDGLQQGATGDDVRSIQDFLANDPSIYPSGLKTGFFGPMTAEAIKRFQTKNGLEVTGAINAETKAALDALMKERHDEGELKLGLFMASSTKDDFEDRLRENCGMSMPMMMNINGSTTAHMLCHEIDDKYHFGMWSHGSSTMPMIHPTPMNGEMPAGMRGNHASGTMMGLDDHKDGETNDDKGSHQF